MNNKNINKLINIIHIIFILYLLSSLFIDNYINKLYCLILIIFIFVHYLTKYGKCGIINIERYFLGKKFKNGIAYKLIKPIISYKNNIFYENGGMYVLLFYIFSLFIQMYINKNKCYDEYIFIKTILLEKYNILFK